MRTSFKVIAADAVLLIMEFIVISDVQNRVNCVLGQPLYGVGCAVRSSPSFSYFPLGYLFSMVSRATTLTSPPTLDWVQLIAVALVVLNVWYVLTVYRSKSAKSPLAAVPKGKEGSLPQ